MATESDEISMLKTRLDNHIEEYRAHISDYTERQFRQDIAHEKNIVAIAELTQDIKDLTKATQGIVDAFKAAGQFQKFVKWLSSFVVVVGFLLWVLSKLPPDFFNTPV